MTGTAISTTTPADPTRARFSRLSALAPTTLAATLAATAALATGCSSFRPLARHHAAEAQFASNENQVNPTTRARRTVAATPGRNAFPSSANVGTFDSVYPARPSEPAYIQQDMASNTGYMTDAVVFRGQSTQSPTADTTIGVYGEPASLATFVSDTIDGAGNMAQITHTTDGACFDPNTSRDGSRIVFASTQHRPTADIYVKSTTGKTVTQITQDPAEDVMPAFGPDGQRIAFASNRDGNWNIYITSIEGGPPMQLTSDFDHELHPTWSPDGRHIAYCRLGSQSGRWEVWVTDLDSRVPHFLDYGLFPEWNPDPARSKIAFQRARERGSRLFSIWTMDYLDGEALHPTEIVSAANAATMHPSWSPDGTRIVFVTVTNPSMTGDVHPDHSDIWVVNLDGTSKANLTGGQFRNLYPVWAADGAVYFLSNRSGIDNIWSVATGRTIDIPLANDNPLVNVDPGSVRQNSNR